MLGEKANELARLRQLRQAATENPEVAIDMSTDRELAVVAPAPLPPPALTAPLAVPPPAPPPPPPPPPPLTAPLTAPPTVPPPSTPMPILHEGATGATTASTPGSIAPNTPTPSLPMHLPAQGSPMADPSAVIITDPSLLPGKLRLHLASNHAKVYDLFREYDVDGAGTVRKVEMRRKRLPDSNAREPKAAALIG